MKYALSTNISLLEQEYLSLLITIHDCFITSSNYNDIMLTYLKNILYTHIIAFKLFLIMLMKYLALISNMNISKFINYRQVCLKLQCVMK